MLSVLFVASEAVPFAKTGGLADVVGSLPKELIKQGMDVKVVMPKYSDIPQEFAERMTLVAEFPVAVSWRQKYCGVLTLEHEGVQYYFIDNEDYFKRDGLYGYFDDGERFAYFCRAVLEMLPQIDYKPDVIHSHDWHASLVNVFLRTHYKDNSFYEDMHTLFTIHNLRYQGVFDKSVLTDLLGLDWSYFRPDALEHNNAVNFMKGGIIASEIISTVSQTYAKEIQDPFFGEGLDGLLRDREFNLTGIVNGIDYELYNPATDPCIFANYDVSSIHKKLDNKVAMQERLGLPVKRDTPVITIISRLIGAKGLDLVTHILDQLLYEDVQLVVLGTGEEQYENIFRQAAHLNPDKVAASINFDAKLALQIYAGADIFLMPSLYEPCGIGQLIALRYGTLPVVRETGGLRDTVQSYNKYTGEGNGFTFENYNAHDMYYTIKRALGMYYDKPVWQRIVGNAMNSNYSWRQSAKQYISLYRRLAE